jgi:hypothetical protein
MKKLEDIPKKTVFKVPDGYFDELPAVIQARMMDQNRPVSTNAFSFSLKFALPIAALIVVGFFLLRPAPSIETQLGEIDTEQIALYLDNTEHIDLEENIETDGFTKSELDKLEDTIYSNMEYPTEDIVEDIDLDNL